MLSGNEIEFDALPPPVLDATRACKVDLDAPVDDPLPSEHPQAFTLWLRARDFAARQNEAVALVRRLLLHNPFTTLQIVLEPEEWDEATVCNRLPPDLIDALLAACHAQPTYLDKYYAMHPGPRRGAKRLILSDPLPERRAMAKRLGASVVVDPTGESLRERVLGLTR